MTSASGAAPASAAATASRVADVELAVGERERLVAGTAGGGEHVLAEHAAGAGHEHPHRIEMSELSPTMKR